MKTTGIYVIINMICKKQPWTRVHFRKQCIQLHLRWKCPEGSAVVLYILSLLLNIFILDDFYNTAKADVFGRTSNLHLYITLLYLPSHIFIQEGHLGCWH